MATDIKAKYSEILKRPRVTEKASFLMEKNVYTFEIDKKANKKEVFGAVKEFYGVVPEKIHIVSNPDKQVFVRGKRGTKAGVKKALVYLKKGDKIE